MSSELKDLLGGSINDIDSMDQDKLNKLMEGTSSWLLDMKNKMSSGDSEEVKNSALEMQEFIKVQMEILGEKSGVDLENLEMDVDELEQLKEFEKQIKDQI